MGDEDTGLGRDFGRLQQPLMPRGLRCMGDSGFWSAATASTNTPIQVFMIVQ